MRGRRSFLRDSLRLLAGGTAGSVSGRLAAAVTLTQPGTFAQPLLSSSCPDQKPETTLNDPAISGTVLANIQKAHVLSPADSSLHIDDCRPPKRSEPQSVMQKTRLITVYGRSFGIAPILGMLGNFKSFNELEQGIEPWVNSTADLTGDRVTVAPHLIYALARPCHGSEDSCLIFLDALRGVDLIEDYIKPAAKRGMAVVLDAQLGRLSPIPILKRMINAGYLSFPNVHIALDPEFSTKPGQSIPGTPWGTLSAELINEAQGLLANYVRSASLSHKKVLIVHQFVDATTNSWSMIPRKQHIKVFPEVELVFDADGFGSPDAKIYKYNAMTDPAVYPRMQWRGIKLFNQNPYARYFSDNPLMTPQQVFGIEPTTSGRRMRIPPNLLVLS